MTLGIKRKTLLVFLLLLTACSGRNYEEFGNISSEKVKNICESYSERVYGTKENAKYVFFEYDLGQYNESVYVNILKIEKEGLLGLPVGKPVYVNSTYICDLPTTDYAIDVWIDGQGSFEIQKAYDDGVLNDENISNIIANAKKYELYKTNE